MEEKSTDPVRSLYQQDLEHAFYSYCSLVTMLKNKKMNIAAIFIETINDDELLDIFSNLCDHRNKYDAVRSFFTIEPSLQKSKYIKRYINKNS
jgi:hypothetical protein